MLNVDAHLRRLIRDVPDFPQPGILFRDVTPLLADAAALNLAVTAMALPFRDRHIELVVGAESRGFIFGTALAFTLSTGFGLIRKPGKLPCERVSRSYKLEYGIDTLEMHSDTVYHGQRVLVVDDLLATGGTMQAGCELIQSRGAIVAGVAVLIELEALGGRAALVKLGIPTNKIHSVLKY